MVREHFHLSNKVEEGTDDEVSIVLLTSNFIAYYLLNFCQSSFTFFLFSRSYLRFFGSFHFYDDAVDTVNFASLSDAMKKFGL